MELIRDKYLTLLYDLFVKENVYHKYVNEYNYAAKFISNMEKEIITLEEIMDLPFNVKVKTVNLLIDYLGEII